MHWQTTSGRLDVLDHVTTVTISREFTHHHWFPGITLPDLVKHSTTFVWLRRIFLSLSRSSHGACWEGHRHWGQGLAVRTLFQEF